MGVKVNQAGKRNKRSGFCGNKHQRTETRTRAPARLTAYLCWPVEKESATPEEILFINRTVG